MTDPSQFIQSRDRLGSHMFATGGPDFDDPDGIPDGLDRGFHHIPALVDFTDNGIGIVEIISGDGSGGPFLRGAFKAIVSDQIPPSIRSNGTDDYSGFIRQ